ncbi:MAG: NAD-dependent epimerase/dehydratase family protein [Acidimicrobiales bacterium]
MIDHDRTAPATMVVTGAAGWLGQNLVRAVAPERERVRCLVRTPEEAALLAVAHPSVDPIVGDVRDPHTLDRLLDGVGDATVVHAAAVIHPTAGIRELYDVNVGGTQLLVDRVRRSGAGRLVHVSSNSPFGANPGPDHRFTEDSPMHPYLGYGRSKAEAEAIVMAAHTRGDLEAVVLRPPWFYGPHQPERQTRWLRAVRRNRFPVVGDGTNRRSMVFTGNLVHAVLRAELADGASGRAYWIADGPPPTMHEVLDTVRAAFAAEGLPPAGGPRPRAPRAVGVLAERADTLLQGRGRYSQVLHVLGELKDTIACDTARAEAELGYRPPTTLLDGMRESIRWCVERGIAL